MKDELRLLGVRLGRIAGFALMVTLPPLLAWLDIRWLRDGIGEWSLVELTQEGFLVASVLAFVHLARRRPGERSFALLAAVLLGCMFLREMDEALDLVVHGFWKYPVTLLAATAIGTGLRNWRESLSGLLRFLDSRAGTLMAIGMVLLLFYSRLLGLCGIWTGLLGEHYLRVFKNAIEEITELLGYTFILVASLAYSSQCLRTPVGQAVPIAGSRGQRQLPPC